MQSRRTVLTSLTCAGTLLFVSPAWAHRLSRTETEVRIHEDGKIDVIHVYHLQDAKDALCKAGRIDTPDLTPLKARAQLALYTSETFTLRSGEAPIDLETLDAQIEGDSVYVYQQGVLGDGQLSVEARMLRDLVHAQSNSVNIVRNGRTVTLDFKRDDGPKSVARD